VTCTPYDIRDADGKSVGWAITCGRGQRKTAPCAFCGAPHTKLCDEPLRGAKAGKTCDAKMCARCATPAGDNRDLCPPHARDVNASRAAAEWLDEVIVEDLNAVDRAALDTMFPDWSLDAFALHEREWDRAHPDRAETAGEVSATDAHADPGAPADVVARGRGGFANGDEAARYICKVFGVDPAELDDIPMDESIPEVAQMLADVAARGPEEVAADLATRGVRPSSLNEKVRHVRRATQTRGHGCHWPGCGAEVPPAQWGCRTHWYALPKWLRDKVWRAYRVGQEETMTPSREYLAVADEVQEWIREHGRAVRAAEDDIPF